MFSILRVSLTSFVFVCAIANAPYRTLAAALGEDPVRIQLETEGVKPWLDFYNAYPRGIYNLAVHGHPLKFTSEMQILPGYIKFWKWDVKRGVYILKMDRSLKYHNGDPISARDFEFALVKPLLTTLSGFDYSFLRSIKGYDKVKRGEPFRSGIVEGVKVVDDETIEISLTRSHKRFLYNLNADFAPMAPISHFKEDLYTFKDTPIGCGPYRIVWSDPKSSLTKLKRVYGNGPDSVDLYTDKFGFENKVDIAFGPGIYKMSDYVEKRPGEYRVEKNTSPASIEILEFNYSLPAANNANFRKAVAYAIDKKNIPTKYKDFRPANQLITEISYGYQPIGEYFNQNQARVLFKSLPKSMRDATYKMVGHGTPGNDPPDYYKYLADNLRAIGMKIELSLSDSVDLDGPNKDVTMMVWGRLFEADPLTTFSDYLPEKNRNKAPRSAPEYANLFEQAENADSVASKATSIKKMSRHIVEQAFVVPLHERYDPYFFSNRIKRVPLTEIAGYLNIEAIEVINDK
jgi:ABC-type transport system substrate-binding protein